MPNARNNSGFYRRGETPKSWANCLFNPANADKKDGIIAGLRKGGRRKGAASLKFAQLEAKLATQEALFKVLFEKIKVAPTAASAKAIIANIVAIDDLDKKEATLYEIVMSLNSMSANNVDAPL